MGLSSAAVVIGLVRERDQEDCPVRRAAQLILIFQDIAAILLLVAAGKLSVSREFAPLVQERMPNIARVIALPGTEGIEEFAQLGMIPANVRTTRGIESIIEMVFQSLQRESKLPASSLTVEEHALEYA